MTPADPEGREAVELGEPGFPQFDHNQWTVEGEIERFGAFGRAGARATGWKRLVAVVLVLAFVGPLVAYIGAGLYTLLT